jgi:hypothetical protein
VTGFRTQDGGGVAIAARQNACELAMIEPNYKTSPLQGDAQAIKSYTYSTLCKYWAD